MPEVNGELRWSDLDLNGLGLRVNFSPNCQDELKTMRLTDLCRH